MNASFSEIAATIDSADSILVASHVRPDGDALGSTLALALWLRGLRKAVTAWNEDGVTQKYRYLPCHELIVAPNSGPRAFDVIVALDNSVKSRLGTVLDRSVLCSDAYQHRPSCQQRALRRFELRGFQRARNRTDHLRVF